MTTLHRLARPSAFAAGLLFLLHYGLHLAHGLMTGGVLWGAMGTPLGIADGVVFGAVYAAVNLALLGVFARLERRAPRLGRVALVASALSLAAATVGVVSFLTGVMVPVVMPVATLAMFLSALLLGVAALRTRALPGEAGATLVGFALLTAPLGMLLVALPVALPLYALFELHFVAAGAAWLALGAALGETREPALVGRPLPVVA